LVAAADGYKAQMKMQVDFAELHRIERERAIKETNRLQQEKLDKEIAAIQKEKLLRLSTEEARKEAAKANLKRLTKILDIADAKKMEGLGFLKGDVKKESNFNWSGKD
jgi:multidrug efflux pump subunit AcrA (membrane-fusion protein)